MGRFENRRDNSDNIREQLQSDMSEYLEASFWDLVSDTYKEILLSKVRPENKEQFMRYVAELAETYKNSSDNIAQLRDLINETKKRTDDVLNQSNAREVEQIPPFEVAGWEVTKKTLSLDWLKNRTYKITGGTVTPIWNNMYKVDIESVRKVGKYGSSTTENTLYLKYTWWNTVQVFDQQTERAVWIVQIQNRQLKEEWVVYGNRYSKRISEETPYINFELKWSWIKIKLELRFNK